VHAGITYKAIHKGALSDLTWDETEKGVVLQTNSLVELGEKALGSSEL